MQQCFHSLLCNFELTWVLCSSKAFSLNRFVFASWETKYCSALGSWVFTTDFNAAIVLLILERKLPCCCFTVTFTRYCLCRLLLISSLFWVSKSRWLFLALTLFTLRKLLTRVISYPESSWQTSKDNKNRIFFSKSCDNQFSEWRVFKAYF